MESATYAEQKKPSPFRKQDIELRPLRASSGNLKGGLLRFVVALALLGNAPIARAECGEQNMQNELAEPKALGRAGLKTQFRDFVLREFPVGSDGGRLLRWLNGSGFSAPNTTYSGGLTLSPMTEEGRNESRARSERIRQGKPLQGSTISFQALCGRAIYKVAWRLDECGTISEIHFDEVRCRLDLP